MERKCWKRIQETKKKARSELNNIKMGWCVDGAFETYSFEKQTEISRQNDFMPRIDASKDALSLQEFQRTYESLNEPIVLTHLTDNWPANTRWTFKNLTLKYKNQFFKCGEDDKGYSVKIKMKYFFAYCKNPKSACIEDSPLYIFDGNFYDRSKKKELLLDFEVPHIFSEDLFKYVGDSKRPPFRWFVMGPARSGTNIHIDPLGTSAWNALIVGHKRWCFFPPNTPKQLLKVQADENRLNKQEAITWFSIIYPRTKQPTWPAQYKPTEMFQSAGETVFVPSGWWHVVMNLDETVAITQNFASSVNFEKVWPKTAKSRPKLSKKWLQALQFFKPELAKETQNIMFEYNKKRKENDNTPTSSSSSSSSSSSEDDSASSDSAASVNSSKSYRTNCSCSDCYQTRSRKTTNNNSNVKKADSSSSLLSSSSESPPRTRRFKISSSREKNFAVKPKIKEENEDKTSNTSNQRSRKRIYPSQSKRRKKEKSLQ